MYLLADTAIDIDCPRQQAFDYAANLENFPHWFPAVIAMQAEDGLPFTAVGKQYRESVDLPLRGRRTVLVRVEEASSPARLVTEGSLALLLPRMEMTFDDQGTAACRVTWRMFSRNPRRWARWTVLPLARRTLARRARIGLQRLKLTLEQQAVHAK